MTDFEDAEEKWLDAVHENGDGTLTPTSAEERKKRQEILRNRSGEALKKKWADEDRAAIDAQVTVPPVISEPKCLTCQSDYRAWIESKLMSGTSYAAIARSIPGVNADNLRRSISFHYKNHMALDKAAVRALMERDADLLNQNYEEGVIGAFTQRSALDILIRKGFDDAQHGITTIEPKDWIQMIKLYGDMNSESGSTAVEEAKTAIRIFMEAIKNVLMKSDEIPREQGERLLDQIQNEVRTLREEEEITNNMERHLIARPTD